MYIMIYVYTYIYIYIHAHAMYIYTCICMHIYTYIRIFTHICIFEYLLIYTYICIYIDLHINSQYTMLFELARVCLCLCMICAFSSASEFPPDLATGCRVGVWPPFLAFLACAHKRAPYFTGECYSM